MKEINKFKICNLTPIQLEILQQKECYITTVKNIWQANYVWINEDDLYKSIAKDYKKDEIINFVLTDCGIPRSKITKKYAIYQIINDASDYLEYLQLKEV